MITYRDVDTPDLLRYGVQHRISRCSSGKITAVRKASSELISASLAPIAQQGVDVLGLPDTGKLMPITSISVFTFSSG